MTEAELLKDCLLRLNQTGVAYMVTPSERQRYDAAGVFAVQQATLDLNYMKLWAVELGVLQTLQDILDGKLKPKQT